MIMVTLTNGTDQVRVAKADEYPGYPDWTVVTEEEWPTLAMLQDEAWSAVKAIRAAKETGTAQTPVGTVQIDEASKLKITGALSLCRLQEELQQPFSLNFTLADNSRVTLTNTTVRQLAGAVGEYVAQVYDRASALRDQIDAATTAAELNAIDLNAGWP